MQYHSSKLLVGILIVTLIVFSSASASFAEDEILIGGALSLTGVQAPLDEPGLKGAQVAVKYLNEQGKCDIYSNRPPVCRNYLVEECDHNMEEIKVFFKTPEKYTEWLKTCRKYQELCRKEKAKNNRLNNKQ